MNISDPIPISSTGSDGSIVGGVDAGRQRSNPGQSGGITRMDSGLGSIPQSSSSASASANGGLYASSSSSSMPLGSPSGEGATFMNSPSGLNMASLALDPQASSSVPQNNQQKARQVVPVGFEEGTLRALCDLDCGFPLLMDRIKQSMASCRVSINPCPHFLMLSVLMYPPAGNKRVFQEASTNRGGIRTVTTEAHSRTSRIIQLIRRKGRHLRIGIQCSSPLSRCPI
jgi:hypothetical protein